jgi:NADH-quinone oxidoreductase subunit G
VPALPRFQEEIAGPLRGGDPGVRLLEVAPAGDAYPAPPPAGGPPRPGERRVAALHHVFGSEELSALAAPLAELIPAPYLALAPADADALGVAEGDDVAARFDETTVRLPLRLIAGLPPGTLGVPVGLPGMPVLPLAEWTRLERP